MIVPVEVYVGRYLNGVLCILFFVQVHRDFSQLFERGAVHH